MDQSAMSWSSEDYPEVIKLNTPNEVAIASPWANLPYLVLIKVFGKLNKEDRENASGVCRNWRGNYFNPECFSKVIFPIQEHSGLEKVRFLSNTFGSTVKHAEILLCSHGEYIKEFISLLEKLSRNNNLNSVIIRSYKCQLEFCSIQNVAGSDDLAVISGLLMSVLPRITSFDIRYVEDLALCPKTILNNLHPSLVSSLGLAAILEDPGRYVANFDNRLKQVRQIKASTDGVSLFGLSELTIDSLEYHILFHILLKSGASHIYTS